MSQTREGFTAYVLEFVKNNVYVFGNCLVFDAAGNFDDAKAQTICIKAAKVVERNIP